eukprot:scaffold3586_cov404-Prasinococcus_capsulatus_cf.AAC.36
MAMTLTMPRTTASKFPFGRIDPSWPINAFHLQNILSAPLGAGRDRPAPHDSIQAAAHDPCIHLRGNTKRCSLFVLTLGTLLVGAGLSSFLSFTLLFFSCSDLCFKHSLLFCAVFALVFH